VWSANGVTTCGTHISARPIATLLSSDHVYPQIKKICIPAYRWVCPLYLRVLYSAERVGAIVFNQRHCVVNRGWPREIVSKCREAEFAEMPIAKMIAERKSSTRLASWRNFFAQWFRSAQRLRRRDEPREKEAVRDFREFFLASRAGVVDAHSRRVQSTVNLMPSRSISLPAHVQLIEGSPHHIPQRLIDGPIGVKQSSGLW
jgi:hypothetical protein